MIDSKENNIEEKRKEESCTVVPNIIVTKRGPRCHDMSLRHIDPKREGRGDLPIFSDARSGFSTLLRPEDRLLRWRYSFQCNAGHACDFIAGVAHSKRLAGLILTSGRTTAGRKTSALVSASFRTCVARRVSAYCKGHSCTPVGKSIENGCPVRFSYSYIFIHVHTYSYILTYFLVIVTGGRDADRACEKSYISCIVRSLDAGRVDHTTEGIHSGVRRQSRRLIRGDSVRGCAITGPRIAFAPQHIA